jgi:hypothetical protein
MNFQEYLLAVGREVMAEALRGTPESIDAASHGQILQELRSYFFCGRQARGGQGVAGHRFPARGGPCAGLYVESFAQRNPTWLLPVSGGMPRRAAGR